MTAHLNKHSLSTASHGSAELPGDTSKPTNALQLADQRTYADKDGRRPSRGGEAEAVLLRVLQQRAPELGDHGDSVAKLAVAVGRRLDLPETELRALARAAELHDIGKMALPDAILEKPGPLTEEEWEFVRQHTILGERILSAAPSLATVAAVIRSSHERWDGAGYPDGLAGEAIPLAARIVFVCDAYDAITAERPYSPARSRDEALEEVRRCGGTQFDPAVVSTFCEVLAARERQLAGG
jgi:two-component system cell cycle response regulator